MGSARLLMCEFAAGLRRNRWLHSQECLCHSERGTARLLMCEFAASQ
jgi:hypothetical protein